MSLRNLTRLIWVAQILAATLVFADAGKPSQTSASKYHVVRVGEMQWDDLKEFSEGLAGVSKDGQWGFIDVHGKLVINLQRGWKYAFPFEDGLAQVDVGGANSDFVDTAGRTIVRRGQSDTNNIAWPRGLMSSPFLNLRFSYGLIPVQNKIGKWGFMNRDGRLIVPPQWDQVLDFHEGLALVSLFFPSNRTYQSGFVNTNGHLEIPLRSGGASSFSEGLAAVSSNGLCGFMDKSGRMVIPPQWEGGEPFRGGISVVYKTNRFGVIDRTGKTTVEPECTGYQLGNPVVVFKQDKKGIIDRTGHVAGGRWWDSVRDPPPRTMKEARDSNCRDSAEYRPKVADDYTVKVKRDKKWGLVDINGKIVVEPIWEDVGYSEPGLTPVKQDGKWGILNRSGTLVVQPRWEAVNYPAVAGRIITAKEGGRWGLFDTDGKVVAKPQWDAVSAFSEGVAAVRVENNWGLIDQAGRIICPPKWDWAEPPHDGLLRIRDGNNWCLMRVERN